MRPPLPPTRSPPRCCASSSSVRCGGCRSGAPTAARTAPGFRPQRRSAVGAFFLAFCGPAYSLFPCLVIDRLTIWQAAAAPASLIFNLVGTVIVLPAILGYTVYAYRVFRGRTRDRSYA